MPNTNYLVGRMLTICSVLAKQKEVHTSFRLASKKEDKQFAEIKWHSFRKQTAFCWSSPFGLKVCRTVSIPLESLAPSQSGLAQCGDCAKQLYSCLLAPSSGQSTGSRCRSAWFHVGFFRLNLIQLNLSFLAPRFTWAEAWIMTILMSDWSINGVHWSLSYFRSSNVYLFVAAFYFGRCFSVKWSTSTIKHF